MAFDILISMITGLYSGLIASKYIRYVHIRSQSIQLVKHAEHLHGHDDKKIGLLRHRDLDHLDSLVGDLTALGYHATARMIREAEQMLRSADADGPAPDTGNGQIDAWIKKMSHRQPAILPTLMAWRI